MEKFGEIIEARIYNENTENYLAQSEGQTFLIPKDSISHELHQGDLVEGMVFEDKDKQAIMQLNLPDIRPGIFGWGQIVSVKGDLGLFVDVGLLNKDVVVSLDELPEDRSLWPQRDDRLFLTYSIDDKFRFWGHIGYEEELNQLFQPAHEKLMNQNLLVTVYQIKSEGVSAISEEGYDVFIHESEMPTKARLGLQVKARVIFVHPDGRLNASATPRSYEAMDDDAEMIYAVLSRTADGFLPYHDKSDPEEIKKYFGISKSQFKKAVGRLMKHERVRQEKGEGIHIKDN